MKIELSKEAIDDILEHKAGNQDLVFKIFELIKDIEQHPFVGKGKPEPLKYDFSGYWSRRINDEHRLIYRVFENEIKIVS